MNSLDFRLLDYLSEEELGGDGWYLIAEEMNKALTMRDNLPVLSITEWSNLVTTGIII